MVPPILLYDNEHATLALSERSALVPERTELGV